MLWVLKCRFDIEYRVLSVEIRGFKVGWNIINKKLVKLKRWIFVWIVLWEDVLIFDLVFKGLFLVVENIKGKIVLNWEIE